MAEPTEREWLIARDVDAALVRISESTETLDECATQCQRVIAEALAAHREYLAEHALTLTDAPELVAVYGAVVANELLRAYYASDTRTLDRETVLRAKQLGEWMAARSEAETP